MSLAHCGVLFLEELPEWKQDVLQVLCQSLDDKKVSISREQETITYPTRFLVVASMQLYLCGFISDPVKECSCSASAVAHYQKRISGPLLDRIDIHVEVPRIDYQKLSDKHNTENLQTIRKRVLLARERQLQRFTGTGLTCNAEMAPLEVREFCPLEPSAEKVLDTTDTTDTIDTTETLETSETLETTETSVPN